MLSAKTTVGKYPVKCVEFLRRIALKSETIPGLQFAKHLRNAENKQQLAAAAVQLAEGVKAKGIVVITRRGLMADLVANYCPFATTIYAFTNMSQPRRTMMPGTAACSPSRSISVRTPKKHYKRRSGF